MHGNKEMLGTSASRGQHGLYDDAMRSVVVGGYHDVGIRTQQAGDGRRYLIK
jgi:hypothetical protein